MSNGDTNAQIQKAMRAVRQGKLEPARRLLQEVVQAEPENELAWLWLARAADPANPGQKQTALRKILQINPDNKWAADELAQLTGSSPAAGSAEEALAPPQQKMPEKQFGEIKLDLIRCPNCAGQVEIHGNDVLTAECPHCQTAIDLGGEAPKAAGNLKKYRPSQPIEPGDLATFGGLQYQVIGWLRFKGWDDEESWTWTEWLLAGADGSYRWLSHSDEDGFEFHRPLPIERKFDLNSGFPVDGAYVTERAPARIVALRGEMTWRATVGDEFRYIDAKKGDRSYSVEYTKDAMELTEGVSLSPEQVWTAFGRNDMLQQIKTGAEAAKHWVQRRNIAWFFGAFFILLTLFTYVAGGRIFEGSTSVNSTNPAATIGPIQIEKAGRPHEIDLRLSSLPQNTWAVVNVTLYDESENEYFLTSAEFWDEDGYDEDGYWHETDLTDQYVFRPEEAGTYTMLVELDEATTGGVSVNVEVFQGIWLARYFMVLAILSIILGFIFNVVADARRV